MGIHLDEPGQIVRFDYHSPDHTVTAFHLGHGRQQRVPDGAAAFSAPVIPAGGFWLYEFDEPGVYDIYCAPHEFLGMVGRIVVGDPESDDFDDDFGTEGRPPVSRPELDSLPGVDASQWVFPVPAETFANSAMSVSNIVDNGPVTYADL